MYKILIFQEINVSYHICLLVLLMMAKNWFNYLQYTFSMIRRDLSNGASLQVFSRR